MTSDEAKQALKEGKKIRCKGWKKKSYLQKVYSLGMNLDEDDKYIEKQAEDDEWEIVE